jgi:hypothetical protein
MVQGAVEPSRPSFARRRIARCTRMHLARIRRKLTTET